MSKKRILTCAASLLALSVMTMRAMPVTAGSDPTPVPVGDDISGVSSSDTVNYYEMDTTVNQTFKFNIYLILGSHTNIPNTPFNFRIEYDDDFAKRTIDSAEGNGLYLFPGIGTPTIIDQAVFTNDSSTYNTAYHITDNKGSEVGIEVLVIGKTE